MSTPLPPAKIHLPQGLMPLPVGPDRLVPFLDGVLRTLVGDPTPRGGMKTTSNGVSTRSDECPNHNLSEIRGRWFAIYTIHPLPGQKRRMRSDLGTDCVEVARKRRDELFDQFAAEGKLATARLPQAAKARIAQIARVSPRPFKQGENGLTRRLVVAIDGTDA